MVTAQVTMHHGQSTRSTKTLWPMNQTTSARDAVVPRLNRTQNQPARRAPASSATPTASTAGQNISPRSGFGKPNTAP